jgi:hypothetical protein
MGASIRLTSALLISKKGENGSLELDNLGLTDKSLEKLLIYLFNHLDRPELVKELWINDTEITEISVFLREDKKLTIVTETRKPF